MDNQQAAKVLRALSNPMRLTGQQYGVRVHEAAERGADAIQFEEWLFEPDTPGAIRPRVVWLWQQWQQSNEPNFRTYAEAHWRASRGD